jgi:hypothetical protein
MSEDLLNDLMCEVQLSVDADLKLTKLEQIKEILLKRSPQLLKTVALDVFDFMLERSVKVRKFMIQFAGEAFIQERTLVVPSFLR